MTRVSCGTAILGAGSAGLAAALALSGRSRVRIIAPTVPAATDAARVDMVPAAFLAFLLELGVHPSQIGVRDLHDVRYIAWTRATPEPVHGAAMAHIQRPALELALLAAVERMSGIRILPGSPSYLTDPDERLIDATGRREPLDRACIFAARCLRKNGPSLPHGGASRRLCLSIGKLEAALCRGGSQQGSGAADSSGH